MAGIVIGCLVGGGLLLSVLVYCLCFRKKYSHHHQVAGGDDPDLAPVNIKTLGRSYAGSFNSSDRKVEPFACAYLRLPFCTFEKELKVKKTQNS